MNTELDKKEYLELMREIKAFGLKVPWYFYTKLNDEDRKRCWNGAGADSTPVWIRWALTQLLHFIPCTIFIHDVQFTYKKHPSDVVNMVFEDNGRKEIECRFSSWNPLRNYAKGLLKIAVRFINKYGSKWR